MFYGRSLSLVDSLAIQQRPTCFQKAPCGDDSRRIKLQKIVEPGYEPYGHRFDDRDMIGDIRNRELEYNFVSESATEVPLPCSKALGK